MGGGEYDDIGSIAALAAIHTTECVLIITHCIAFSTVNLDNVPAKAHFRFIKFVLLFFFAISISCRREKSARARTRVRVRSYWVGIRNMSEISKKKKISPNKYWRDLSCWSLTDLINRCMIEQNSFRSIPLLTWESLKSWMNN